MTAAGLLTHPSLSPPPMQHHAASLDLSVSPLDYLSRLYPGEEGPPPSSPSLPRSTTTHGLPLPPLPSGNKPELMRAHLGSFGLSGDLALQVRPPSLSPPH